MVSSLWVSAFPDLYLSCVPFFSASVIWFQSRGHVFLGFVVLNEKKKSFSYTPHGRPCFSFLFLPLCLHPELTWPVLFYFYIWWYLWLPAAVVLQEGWKLSQGGDWCGCI